eukprot:1158723-Pelagomonas_calceolata.AAC.3
MQQTRMLVAGDGCSGAAGLRCLRGRKLSFTHPQVCAWDLRYGMILICDVDEGDRHEGGRTDY